MIAPASAQVLRKLDNWTVYRSKDNFTGQVSCRIISRKGSLGTAFLTVEKNEVVFLINRTPKVIRWRLDDGEVHTTTSKTLFFGLNRVLEATRLRVHVTNTRDEVHNYDFQLTGLSDALKLLDRPDCRN
ncbi:MAG TPA: hypothetical protein VFM35_10620 [Candidatus Binatia bacterium]|nr:hypothetical protein [Candidatus Binatia bacterium]